MPESGPRITIRAATPADADTIYAFVLGLAEYEKLQHEVVGSADAIRCQLERPAPPFEVLLAELDGEPVGFALFFSTYSTFHTAECLHLEDLFVSPNARGAGVGRRLLAAVARVADDRGCPRLQWNVLDWNEPAIRFYERLGATVLPDWRTVRVDGAVLSSLARGGETR